MLKLFGKYVIGGRSGKREQAWAVFLLWCVAFGWSAYQEASGVSVQSTQGILSATVWAAIANLAAAHGIEAFNSQSRWGVSE
jgi:hypothetical protein